METQFDYGSTFFSWQWFDNVVGEFLLKLKHPVVKESQSLSEKYCIRLLEEYLLRLIDITYPKKDKILQW